ncbi:MAG: hypothetical protein ACKESB_02025 [Candidatus Hodgkinia cicadicola]
MTSICKTAIKISKTEEVKKLIEGRLIQGIIKHKNNSFMLVDIGFKREAKVPNLGAWNYEHFKTGQPIQVYIEYLDSTTEDTLATRRQLDTDEAWDAATLAQASEAWVKGTIVGSASEGLVICVFGLPALLPFRLIGRRLLSELPTGLTTDVKLLEVDRSKNHILLVKRTDEDDEWNEEDEDDTSELQIGDAVWGVVREISKLSVSIDLGWRRGVLMLSSEMWYDILTFVNSTAVGDVVMTLYGGIVKAGALRGALREVERETREAADEWEGEDEGRSEDGGGEEEGEDEGRSEDGGGEEEGMKDDEDDNGSGGDESDDVDTEEVAMLFLEQSVEDEENDIVYGIVEEVTEQTAMLRMSPALVQPIETAAFEAAHHVAVGDIVKVRPTRLGAADKLVALAVDAEGWQYLKFVEANIEFAIEGLISEIKPNYVIVTLSNNIFGKLEISELLEGTNETPQTKAWEGCTVTVEICDFCPETNTIYLNAVDDECTRAALVEVSTHPSQKPLLLQPL